MEKDLTAEFLVIMSRMKKIRFNSHMHDKVLNGEGMMLYTICEYYESEEGENGTGLCAGELAKAMCMSKSAVSKMLNVLELKDLAERYVDKEDRRVVYIKLTKRGNEYIRRSKQSMKSFTEKIMDKLGKDDLETLIRVLQHLYEIMKEEAENYNKVV